MSRIICSCSLLFCAWYAMGQETFDPPLIPQEIRAARATGKITIDGVLDEPDWNTGYVLSDLVQYEPRQGEPPSLRTEIRILFDQDYLYFSGVCYDSLGRKGVRVPNMQRDFDYYQNDLLGIAIDGLLDKRNAVAFQTNPYGAQRELLVTDGNNLNREWISLWNVKTTMSNSGWTAEFAIPWKSIRYKPGADRLGVIFVRSIRRLNEYVTFPAIPRAFIPYQMAYEALLTGLELPATSGINVQLNPYVLGSADRTTKNSEAVDNSSLKAGGELKWAIGTNSVLDLTYNTDFAQVDLDRQVVNLGRFSILFPERRQFFLEGNEIYTMQAWDGLQPFFSRRIGLDDSGNPVPIEAGARFTSRGSKQNIGALAIRQEAQGNLPAANFGVARYSRNFLSTGSRVGALATYRFDEADTTGRSNANTTVTIDGLYRPNQKVNAFWMLSGSNNTGLTNNSGWSGALWAYYSSNDIYVGHVQTIISDEYDPRAGFVDATNYVLTSPAVGWKLRPSWLPSKWLRQITPSITTYFFHYYDDLSFREGFIEYSPVSLDFQNGGSFSYDFVTNWQNLLEPFFPLNVEIAAGRYTYNTHSFSFESDNSRKLYFSAEYNFGGYFDGRLQSFSTSVRIVPDPHVAMTLSYGGNKIQNLGVANESVTTQLATAEVRLALNPRIQWNTFYQYNSAIDRGSLNTRLQWEYKPLSFLFLVFNDNRQQVVDSESQLSTNIKTQQAVFKITYLQQF